jgi:choline-glycine betaine transporter
MDTANKKFYLLVAATGALAGGLLILTAGLQSQADLPLPSWTYPFLFCAGMAVILISALYTLRKKPALSRTTIVLAVALATLFNAVGLVYADYTGPLNRTTTTSSWERRQCSYLAIYDPAGPG